MKKLPFILFFIINVPLVKAQRLADNHRRKQVIEQTINKDTKESLLQPQNLGSGFYFVNLIVDGNLIETQKVIKQ